MKLSSSLDFRKRGLLVLLVLASLGFCVFVMAFRDAVDATPDGTTDSAGRTMGFNDQFSEEHFEIIMDNVSYQETLASLDLYRGVLLGAQLVMLGLLISRVPAKWIFRFALLQVLIFPWGTVGLIMLPDFIIDLINRDVGDREAFVDIPYVAFRAHPVWILVSAVLAFAMFREGRRGSAGPDLIASI